MGIGWIETLWSVQEENIKERDTIIAESIDYLTFLCINFTNPGIKFIPVTLLI